MKNVNPQAAEAVITTTPTTIEGFAREFVGNITHQAIHRDVKAVRKQKKFKNIGHTTEWMANLDHFVYRCRLIIEAEERAEFEKEQEQA